MSQQDACGQSESVLRAQALDAMREALVVPLMRAFWRHRYDRKLTRCATSLGVEAGEG